MKFLVVIDRPFYPRCREFDSIEEAVKFYHRVADEEHDETGDLTTRVHLAAIVGTREIRTFH